MGLKNCTLEQLEHQEAIIDGYHGQIYISPTKKLLKEFMCTNEKCDEKYVF